MTMMYRNLVRDAASLLFSGSTMDIFSCPLCKDAAGGRGCSRGTSERGRDRIQYDVAKRASSRSARLQHAATARRTPPYSNLTTLAGSPSSTTKSLNTAGGTAIAGASWKDQILPPRGGRGSPS
mmetsp:Transcript_51671/g.109878  ORF Transcript_51671/g.109878 Transcript_51671/m.109878 type:complete len:124 (+) Transcript_51671:46-417(+)